MQTAVFSVLLTFLAAPLPGCINADPSTFPNVDAGSTVRPDVVRDTADDVDPHASCRACMEAPEDPGPGCGGALGACMADAKCALVYECGYTHECWTVSTQTDLTNCGFPCFVEAGVTSFGDPAVALMQALGTCYLGGCQAACGVSP